MKTVQLETKCIIERYVIKNITYENVNIRNLLDMHTTKIPTASGLCGSVSESLSTRRREQAWDRDEERPDIFLCCQLFTVRIFVLIYNVK